MRLLALTFLALSCAPPCVAASGLRLVHHDGPLAGWSCDAFRHASDKAIAGYKTVADQRFYAPSLKSWKLVTFNVAFGYLPGTTTKAAGITDCYGREIHVNNQKPLVGPMAHEMAHAIQNCDPLVMKETQDADQYHAGWYSRGIWQALSVIEEPEK